MRMHYLGRGGVPAMPKQIRTKADALQALNRYVICTEKGEEADLRAYRNGGSVTADRHRATAQNWQDKADVALDALRAYLLEG